jgi:DNA primase
MISAAHLDGLKAAIPLADVVGRRVLLTRHGPTYLGRCPFHQERTPSFHVFPDHYHCFGCDAHGDLFKFVMLGRSALRSTFCSGGVSHERRIPF